MKPLKSQNFYEILNISGDASQEDIRKAYEICRTTFEGDSLATYSLFSGEENEEIFALITRAYQTLRDPQLRREYDSQLESQPASGLSRGFGAGHIAAVIGGSDDPPAGTSPPPARSGAPALGEREGDTAQKTPEQPPGWENYLASVKIFNGQALKKIRQMRGIELEELSEVTKIRRAYLQYLETEDFSFLPAPVYVKGFVILIAGALGLPAQKVANDYMINYQAKGSPPHQGGH